MGGVPLKTGDTVVGGSNAAGSDEGPDDDVIARRAAKAFNTMTQAQAQDASSVTFSGG